MRTIRADRPELPPRAVVEETDALLRRHKTHQAVRGLQDRFGADRVEYAVCDVLDPRAVQDVVDRVLSRDGQVDFVVHAAGTVTSTLLRNKRLEGFRATRDTKVLGHLHLSSALGGHRPGLWCNIGSYSGTAGAPGDTDYASGNAYLEAAAETAVGTSEITIGFTMWGQTGMGADSLFQEHVARQQQFTPIGTAEGTAQFLTELRAAPLVGGVATYLGQAELDRLRRHAPGLVHGGPPVPSATRQRPSWWGTPRPSWPGSGEWACPVTPEEERHLFDHLVSGKPTVPATFLLDIAAQAAEALVPGAVTTGFRAARFDTFVRPFSRRVPAPLRVKARLSPGAPTTPRASAAVRVSIHADVLGPEGRLRPAALRHFETEVLLARAPLPGPPGWEPPAGTSPVEADDAYASSRGPVQLRGVFRNLSRCRVDSAVSYGTWTPGLAGNPALRTMTTPALLTCAALRTSALRPTADGRHPPSFVPGSIGRIDLHTYGANDHDLLLRHGHSLLVSVDEGRTYRAGTPDGQLLVEISDVVLADMAQPGTAGDG